MSTFLVGGYTDDMGGSAEGIAVLSSTATGTLALDGLFATADSPSYLLVDGPTVFAVCKGSARIEAFDIVTGDHLGGDAAGGVEPCHISRVDDTLLVSCYGDGSLGMLRPDPVRLTASLPSEGSGPRPEQTRSHAHGTLAVSDPVLGDLVLSADLGADRVHVHRLVDGVLVRERSIALPAGSGPRDLVRHPSGLLLVLAELSNELFVLDAELRILGSKPIPGAQEGDHAAGISVHGDHVFVALRGSNLIAGFELVGGLPVALGTTPCAGDWPRHHVIDGGVLHVANQRSSSVSSFAIAADGSLSLLGDPLSVPSPTCLVRVDLEPAQTLLK